MRRTLNLTILSLFILSLLMMTTPFAMAQDDTDTTDNDDAAAETTEEDTASEDDSMSEDDEDADAEEDTNEETDTPPTTSGGAIRHVVQPGENLFRISLRYGVTVQALATANGIANPNLIFVGQELNISGGTDSGATGGGNTGTDNTGGGTPSQYTVVAGDNLSRIARNFNTTVQAIASANNIQNVNLILVGQVLNIPGGTGTTDGGSGSGDGNTDSGNNGGGGFELGGQLIDFSAVDRLETAGMTWVKVQIEYTEGVNADISAPAINAAHLAGYKILLSIVGDVDELAAADFETYTNDFAEWLGGIAMLGPEAVEIWNEPNINREWPSGTINGANYTTMLRKGYEAIKAENPNILVISGAPAPTGFFGGQCTPDGCDDAPFLAQMSAAGAANYMDCVGAHYNEGIISPTLRSGDPRDVDHYTRYYFGMLDTYHNAFGGAVPVCFTELGYVSDDDFAESLPAGFAWANNVTVQQHAQWLGEAAQLSRASGRVRLMIVWNVNFTSVSPDPMGMYAIIRPDGSCPACDTLAQAMQ